MTKRIEVNGKSYESAVEKGLNLLGLSNPDEAVITILKDNGFLFNKYKLLIEKKMSDAEIAVNFLENYLAKAGYDFAVESEDSPEAVAVNIIGVDSSSLIGYHGETLDALQYLTGVVVNKGKSEFKRVTVDTEGYRDKRAESLKRLAYNLEKKVERIRQPVILEPMNAYERRIIHFTLQNSSSVATHSEGNGSDRHIVISPKRSVNPNFKPRPTSSRSNPRPTSRSDSSSYPSRSHASSSARPNLNDRSEPDLAEADTQEAVVPSTSSPTLKKPGMNFVYSSEKKKRANPIKNKS